MNIKLNESPVRTARNFNINNIRLENVNFPENVQAFKSFDTFCESTKDRVEFKQNDICLKYGLGKTFTDQKSNCNLVIDVNSKMKNTIMIDFKFDKENTELAERILVEAKADTKSNIIIKYTSKEELEYFHNGIIKVKAYENSEVNIIFVNLLNTKSSNFIAIENEILDDAKVNSCIIDFGGKYSISNYYSNIVRKKC